VGRNDIKPLIIIIIIKDQNGKQNAPIETETIDSILIRLCKKEKKKDEITSLLSGPSVCVEGGGGLFVVTYLSLSNRDDVRSGPIDSHPGRIVCETSGTRQV
jgi:hypothetical protein